MTTVVCHLVADMITIGGAHCQVPVELRYDPADPYAVTLDFPGTTDGIDPDIQWCFARDLLCAGLRFDANPNAGDVRVWPGGHEINVRLSSPDGNAVLTLPAADVARFVRDSYRTVPRGREHEHLDVDAIDRVVDEWRAEISEGGAA